MLECCVENPDSHYISIMVHIMNAQFEALKKPISLELNSPLAIAMGSALLLSTASPVFAAPCSPYADNTYTVTNDSGADVDGSFLRAIANANTSTDPTDCNEIVFNESVTDIQLSSAFNTFRDIDIIGHGADTLNISNPNPSYGRVINATSGNSLHVSDLTISNTPIGIYTYGALSVDNAIFDSNEIGVHVTGNSVTVDNSIFKHNNTANSDAGSGLYVLVFNNDSATVNISNSTFDSNGLTASGAAAAVIRRYGGDTGIDVAVSIDNTSFTNSEGGVGGGLSISGGSNNISLDIDQSTFSGNDSSAHGGAIFIDVNHASASVNIDSSTIFNNSASAYTGGVYINLAANTPPVSISNTVIANNSDVSGRPNFSGTINAEEYNWFGEIAAITFENTVDVNTIVNGVNEDGVLDALASNGGLGLTHLPSATSPLIDAGDPSIANAPSLDQNGAGRINNSIIDIGASEYYTPTATGDSEGSSGDPDDPVDAADPDGSDAVRSVSNSGAMYWLLFPLGLLGFRRKLK